MKRISKAILVAAALLVILGVAGVFALNAYVRSANTRARLQAQLGEALGLPVEITDLSVGLGGLHVKGVRIPSGERNLLEAPLFSADYKLLPLLSRHVAVRRVRLESPKVVWAQNAEGKWVLPLLPVRGQKERTKLPNAAAPEEKTSEKSQGGWNFTIDRLEIANASIELLDAQQQRVAIATGVQMEYRITKWDQVEGSISAQQVLWKGYPGVTELQSPLRYIGGELALNALQAQVAGGTVQGQATVKTDAPDSPFTLQLTLDRVDLARLTAEMGSTANSTSGRVAGTVEAAGVFADFEKTTGKGRLSLTDGRLRGFSLFDSVSESISLVLPLPNLSNVAVRTGQAEFHFNNEKLYVDSLLLENSDLRVGAKGAIRADGKVTLDAQLAVNPKIVEQIQSVARQIFSTPDASNRQTTEFKIFGTLEKPKTDLGKRFVEQQIGDQFGDLLSRLTGKDREKDKEREKEKDREKKEKKERKKAEEAAKAAGAPVPAETGERTERGEKPEMREAP